MRRRQRRGPNRLVSWRWAKPLLRSEVPQIGQGGQAIGRWARSASTYSMMCTAKTRAHGHTARISCVSVWASSIVLSSCCTEASSWRMLSLRHSIGTTAPLESLARNSKSVPHLRCYATPPLTESCAQPVLSHPQGTAQEILQTRSHVVQPQKVRWLLVSR
jgi:hypothetical protein